MKASDTMPLPIPANDVPTVADTMERLRAVYSQAVSDIVDRCLEEVLLPNDQAALCLDVAQFTTFLMAAKVVEARGHAVTRENLFAAYWPMQKALKDDVPDMLRALAHEAYQQ